MAGCPGNIQMVVATEQWAQWNSDAITSHTEAELHIVKDHELEALSGMKTPNGVLLVVPIPPAKDVPMVNEWYLALEDLQDPGNMGTIIRIADWFGIHHFVCSPGCVDVYNPKVVQSAMGGHLRVNFYEQDLPAFLGSCSLPKYAAVLGGESVYNISRSEAGVIIIGNESKGISPAVSVAATVQVTIPRRGGAESLNAAVSAGILCSLLLPC